MKRITPGKILLFIFYLLLTSGLTYLYNTAQGPLPPPGKFFDPFGGFWQNAEGRMLFKSGEQVIAGLEDEVTVNFDERLVPHVYANNLHDLYFMQGYVTAKYRLWQMDMQTRAASGRLAEVAGEKALPLDRLTRRLGLPDAARQSSALMMNNPESKAIIDAYTAGVNARINELRPADYPFEFKLLNYTPEVWSPYKTALLLKYMANMLTGHDQDMENTNALRLFGRNNFEMLFPVFPDTLLDPIIPSGTAYKKAVTIPQQPALNTDTTAWLNPLTEKPEPDLGSNNWAVAGSRTASGKPILCNDPHLALNLPSIWFEIHLQSPQMNVYGATIPGAPCVISGFNDSIAWGITNAAMDVKDWYKIRFKDPSRNEYRYDGEWKKTRKLIEKISVKGKESVYDTVVYTHLGPVTYDRHYHQGVESENLALRWTAHDPGNELLTFFKLNQATNYAAYSKALDYYKCPGQNFVFASSSGDIAIRQQGQFVNRYKDQGRFVMDGSTSATAWQGFIPDSANPVILNPERGWVSSANQHPTDTTWPYHYQGIYEFYRNRRINQQLSQIDHATVENMMQLQNDNYNLYARESIPILLKYLNFKQLKKEERTAAGFLLQWNYFNDPGQIAPVIFETWWKHFQDMLWDEFSEKNSLLEKPQQFFTVRYIQKNPNGSFIDIASTPEKEDLNILCLKSFRKANEEISEWQLNNPGRPLAWAYFKDTYIQHLSRQKALNVEHVFIGGNPGIVNACSENKGPSWRMIVSPGPDGVAFGVYPGGQSGNPGSRFYANFINHWSSGRYYSLRLAPKNDPSQKLLYRLHAKGE